MGSEWSEACSGSSQLGAFSPKVNPGLLLGPAKEAGAIFDYGEAMGPSSREELTRLDDPPYGQILRTHAPDLLLGKVMVPSVQALPQRFTLRNPGPPGPLEGGQSACFDGIPRPLAERDRDLPPLPDAGTLLSPFQSQSVRVS